MPYLTKKQIIETLGKIPEKEIRELGLLYKNNPKAIVSHFVALEAFKIKNQKSQEKRKKAYETKKKINIENKKQRATENNQYYAQAKSEKATLRFVSQFWIPDDEKQKKRGDGRTQIRYDNQLFKLYDQFACDIKTKLYRARNIQKSLKGKKVLVFENDDLDKKFEEFTDLDWFDGFKAKCELYSRSNPNGLLVDFTNFEITETNTEPLSFRTTRAMDDTRFVQKMMYNSRYFSENPIKYRTLLEHSCWLNLLMGLFQEQINKAYKDKLTIEKLALILDPNQPLQESHNAYCFNQVLNFFKLYRIGIYIFDINMCLREYYKPETRNKHITPDTIYVLYHNHHIWRMDGNLASLRKKKIPKNISLLTEKIESDNIQKEAICGKPKSTFSLFRKGENTTTLLAKSIPEIESIIFQQKKNNNDENDETDDENDSQTTYILYTQSIRELFVHFYNKGIHGIVKTKSRSLVFDELIFQTAENRFVIQALIEEGVSDTDKEFETQEHWNHYQSVKNRLYNQCFSRNYISYYSQNVKDMLNTYTRANLVGSFITGDCCNNLNISMFGETQVKFCESYIEWDKNKYYTSILKDLPFIPYVNEFSNFKNYDNSPIIDNYIYFVEKIGEEYVYPIHPYNTCYGINIKNIENIKILKVLETQIVNSFFKDIIEEIYNDPKLDEKMKKDLINHTIGNFNKVYNTKIHTMISTDESEALLFKKDYNCPYFKFDEFYVNTLQNKTMLDDGFRLISLLVYDTSHKQLLDLKEKIRKAGVRVYGCNTDALYVENTPNAMKFKKANPEMFNFKHKGDYEAIGKLKETIHHKPYVFGEFKKFNLMDVSDDIRYVPPAKKEIMINNEYDTQEIISKIENKTIITALCAGAGKTFALVEYSKQHKTLFVVPYNTLCFELKKDGVECITRNNLMGELFDGENTKNKIPFDISDFTTIVFDEIFLYSVEILQKIHRFMLKHSDKLFLATGDEFQNKPITTNNKSLNRKEIVDDMFPNSLILKQNKRGTTEEDKVAFQNLSYDVRNLTCKKDFAEIVKKYNLKVVRNMNDVITKRNISHLNKTCDEVNDIIYKKNHPDKKYFVGMKLICNKSYVYKTLRLYVNYTYNVVAITDEYFLLNDGLEEKNLIVNRKLIDTHFKLPYSQTCYSLQGLAVDEPFTIFDINNYFVDIRWIYTAITRATKIEDIHLYFGESEELEDIKKRIYRMIQAYKRNDEKREALMTNYIDTNWVLKKLKNTRYCCYCGDELNEINFSVDRKDNNLNHTKENCQITCLYCNVSKK